MIKYSDNMSSADQGLLMNEIEALDAAYESAYIERVSSLEVYSEEEYADEMAELSKAALNNGRP